MADGKIRIDTTIDTAQAEADLGKLEGACQQTADNIQKTAHTIFDNKGKPIKLIDVNSDSSLKKAEARLAELRGIIEERVALTEKALEEAWTDSQSDNELKWEELDLRPVREEFEALTQRVNEYKEAKADIPATEIPEIPEMPDVSDVAEEVGQIGEEFDEAGEEVYSFGDKASIAFSMAKSGADKIGNALEKGIKKISRYVLAVFGIRSAFMGVKSLMNTFISNNEELSNSIAGIKGALSEMLGPAIIWIINLAKTAMAYINAFVTALTGVDYVARWNAKALEKQTSATTGLTNAQKKNRQLASFDEQNKLSSDSSSSGGGGGGGGSASGLLDLPELSEETLAKIQKFAEGLKSAWERAKKNKEVLIAIAGLIATVFAVAKIALFISKLGEAGISLGSMKGVLVIVAGLILTLVGYVDAWANSTSWGDLALIITGLGVVVAGLYIQFGSLAASIGVVVGGIAMLVLGVKDFISNGPTLQNTILIIGGAIAVAVGLATAGLSVVVAAIVGAVVAVTALTAAIILEKPAIMSTEEAQEKLQEAIANTKEAQEKLTSATQSYTNAVDAAEASQETLEAAEKKTGISGADLQKQVEAGTLSYANMTDAQKEVYKAYIDNEKKQADLAKSEEELKKATEELEKAKRAEIKASYENDLALAKESGNYDKYKKAVISAYKDGTLSAEDARELLEKSMSEMSTDAQNAFMKDIPSSIKNGLNPNKYETTRKKIVDFFQAMWKGIKKVFSDVGNFFKAVGIAIANAVSSAFKSAMNKLFISIETKINTFVRHINSAIGIINKIPGVSISTISPVTLPRLAQGGIVNNPGRGVPAIIGEAGAEAVLPLERNTEWMDILADKINSGNVTIPIYLDGQLITRQVIDRQKRMAFARGGTI